MVGHRMRSMVTTVIFVALSATGILVNRMYPELPKVSAGSGLSYFGLAGVVFGVLALCGIFALGTQLVVRWKRKPAVEAAMVGRLYWLLGVIAIVMSVAYGFGVLGTFGTAFSLFGGMLLGWSLQGPVSGFAAWVLVSMKRPFRPGDRVQFPNLGLTGDIKEIGPMYTVLNQVGGSIGSEEAVNRHILVPNAMLFAQVAINYTVSQEAAYMLDEVVVRITYDSDWKAAEEVLLKAANEVTGVAIKATGKAPYIRADLYDYGVYMRLRYYTLVKDRVETSYLISKSIFGEIQKTPSVDIAIPFVYSAQAGQDRKPEEVPAVNDDLKVVDIEVARVIGGTATFEKQDIELLALSIEKAGLLQPIVVVKKPGTEDYEILAGHLRFEACKKLKWDKIPAVVRGV